MSLHDLELLGGLSAYLAFYRPTISSGLTQASNSSALR